MRVCGRRRGFCDDRRCGVKIPARLFSWSTTVQYDTYTIHKRERKERADETLWNKMSIAVLKRKSAAKYHNMSVNKRQFSIQGTFRNQGFVGQTMLSRHFTRSNNGQISIEPSGGTSRGTCKPTVRNYADAGIETSSKTPQCLCPNKQNPRLARNFTVWKRNVFTQDEYTKLLGEVICCRNPDGSIPNATAPLSSTFVRRSLHATLANPRPIPSRWVTKHQMTLLKKSPFFVKKSPVH